MKGTSSLEGYLTYFLCATSLVWGSLLNYKRGDLRQGKGDLFLLPQSLQAQDHALLHVFSGSFTTTKYIDKQDVWLLSYGRP